MKHLILIIHADLKQSTADLLHGLEEVDGFTFTNAEGHGSQSNNDLNLSDTDKVVGYVPRLRVDILLDDLKVEAVLRVFRQNNKSPQKLNFYWVTDVIDLGRF